MPFRHPDLTPRGKRLPVFKGLGNAATVRGFQWLSWHARNTR